MTDNWHNNSSSHGKILLQNILFQTSDEVVDREAISQKFLAKTINKYNPKGGDEVVDDGEAISRNLWQTIQWIFGHGG